MGGELGAKRRREAKSEVGQRVRGESGIEQELNRGQLP